MVDLTTELVNDFEAIKHSNEGIEFWEARELMPILGYNTWRQFVESGKAAEPGTLRPRS